MKATLRGTAIYFDIAGMQLAPKGNDFVEQPVLFMLHGGPGGDHLRFKQHSLELQEFSQMVLIDHRGCGRSKKTKRADYTLENNIEDIEALRKQLGLEKIALLGTSYGGVVAQGYAIRYPNRVAKLILVATTSSFRHREEAKKYLQKHGSPTQIAMAEHLWNGTFKNPAHVSRFFKLMESLYSTTVKKNPQKAYSKSQTIWSHDALNEGFGGFLRTLDYTPKLKKIKCPTLVLAGDKDWICSANQARILAKEIPRAQLRIFKNCGHAVGVDAHRQYIAAIKKFLQGR